MVTCYYHLMASNLSGNEFYVFVDHEDLESFTEFQYLYLGHYTMVGVRTQNMDQFGIVRCYHSELLEQSGALCQPYRLPSPGFDHLQNLMTNYATYLVFVPFSVF